MIRIHLTHLRAVEKTKKPDEDSGGYEKSTMYNVISLDTLQVFVDGGIYLQMPGSKNCQSKMGPS